MKENVFRWILFGVLFVRFVDLGWVFAYGLWVAGGPSEPPDVKAYSTKWANIYGIPFLTAGLGAAAVLIRNVRWHLLHKRD
jgi:hypothetical protein